MLTDEQEKECRRLKGYFPFRIICGVIYRDSGEFEALAVTTMRKPNKLAREGHSVFVLS